VCVCVCVCSLTHTESASAIQQVSRFTDALEAAVLINAHAVQTDVPNQTLISV